MKNNEVKKSLSPEKLREIFPPSRTDEFFDALFGDPGEGAYDIEFRFKEILDNRLEFEFHLKQRPGRCLACNLTYGLPQVFQRHPVINLTGLVEEIKKLLPGFHITGWEMGYTRAISPEIHIIPLSLFFIPEEDIG